MNACSCEQHKQQELLREMKSHMQPGSFSLVRKVANGAEMKSDGGQTTHEPRSEPMGIVSFKTAGQ